MNKTQLNEIKEVQPKGWAKKLASKCKVTPDQVRKVMRGDSYNTKIINAAIQLAHEEKANKEYMERQIRSLKKLN